MSRSSELSELLRTSKEGSDPLLSNVFINTCLWFLCFWQQKYFCRTNRRRESALHAVRNHSNRHHDHHINKGHTLEELAPSCFFNHHRNNWPEFSFKNTINVISRASCPCCLWALRSEFNRVSWVTHVHVDVLEHENYFTVQMHFYHMRLTFAAKEFFTCRML